MTPAARAARDLNATREMIRMANALAGHFGLAVPPGMQPTRGTALDKAMFQREAVATFLGDLVDAVLDTDAARLETVQVLTLDVVRAWIRDAATFEELATLPGIGKALAIKLKAEV